MAMDWLLINSWFLSKSVRIGTFANLQTNDHEVMRQAGKKCRRQKRRGSSRMCLQRPKHVFFAERFLTKLKRPKWCIVAVFQWYLLAEPFIFCGVSNRSKSFFDEEWGEWKDTEMSSLFKNPDLVPVEKGFNLPKIPRAFGTFFGTLEADETFTPGRRQKTRFRPKVRTKRRRRTVTMGWGLLDINGHPFWEIAWIQVLYINSAWSTRTPKMQTTVCWYWCCHQTCSPNLVKWLTISFSLPSKVSQSSSRSSRNI